MRRISVGDRQEAIQEVSEALWTYRACLLNPPIFFISPFTPAVYEAAIYLNSYNKLNITATHELQFLNRLSTLNNEKQLLDGGLRSAEQQLRKMDQKTRANQSDLQQWRRLRLQNIDKARGMIAELRTPFEAEIEVNRQVLEDTESELPEVRRKHVEVSDFLLRSDKELSALKTEQADLKLESSSSVRVEVVEALLLSRKPIVADLKKREKSHQKKIQSLVTTIEKTKAWLAQNDICLTDSNIGGVISQLDAASTALAHQQKSRWNQWGATVLQYAGRSVEYLSFDHQLLAEAATCLREVARLDIEITEASVLSRDFLPAKAEKERVVQVQGRVCRQKEDDIAAVTAELDKSLSRDLVTEGLIPDDNIYAQHLHEFDRELAALSALKESDEATQEAQARIKSIEVDCSAATRQYAQALASVSKPFKMGWCTQKEYYAEVARVRTGHAETLKDITNPLSRKNIVLKSNPAAFARLSRLHRVATVLLSCIVIGLPYGLYRLYKNYKKPASKRCLEMAHDAASPLAQPNIVRPAGAA